MRSPSAARLTATITYCLSETGRERSVKTGCSGAYHQNATGRITPEDLTLFSISPQRHISTVFNWAEFDAPQEFRTLLAHLRKRHQRLSTIRTVLEAEGMAQVAFGDHDDPS